MNVKAAAPLEALGIVPGGGPFPPAESEPRVVLRACSAASEQLNRMLLKVGVDAMALGWLCFTKRDHSLATSLLLESSTGLRVVSRAAYGKVVSVESRDERCDYGKRHLCGHV